MFPFKKISVVSTVLRILNPPLITRRVLRDLQTCVFWEVSEIEFILNTLWCRYICVLFFMTVCIDAFFSWNLVNNFRICFPGISSNWVSSFFFYVPSCTRTTSSGCFFSRLLQIMMLGRLNVTWRPIWTWMPIWVRQFHSGFAWIASFCGSAVHINLKIYRWVISDGRWELTSLYIVYDFLFIRWLHLLEYFHLKYHQTNWDFVIQYTLVSAISFVGFCSMP